MERSDELSRRLCYLAAMFATAMAVAWTVDVPVASYFRLERQPEFFHELVSFAEVFGHGVGVAYILLAAVVLDVHQRRRLPRIVAAIVGAGLLADLVKLAVGRIRPRAMALDQVWDSFVGWFPKFHPEIRLGLSVNDCQSIPSGHAAVATALAIGLSLLYPRGRWLFACFAVLVWLQRIETCHTTSAIRWPVRPSHAWSGPPSSTAAGWDAGLIAGKRNKPRQTLRFPRWAVTIQRQGWRR